jgi:peptidoglycan/xylan/chitin deacetylase (PgdA/CDA1 family)
MMDLTLTFTFVLYDDSFISKVTDPSIRVSRTSQKRYSLLVLKERFFGMVTTVNYRSTRLRARQDLILLFLIDGCIYSPENIKRVKYAYEKGHMVASHTWAHKNLSTLTAEELDSEMGLVDQALERIIGVKPAFMRPPYGSYNDLVRKVAEAHGQRLAIWDFDSGDSIGLNASQSNALYDDVTMRHPSTILALGHETRGM